MIDFQEGNYGSISGYCPTCGTAMFHGARHFCPGPTGNANYSDVSQKTDLARIAAALETIAKGYTEITNSVTEPISDDWRRVELNALSRFLAENFTRDIDFGATSVGNAINLLKELLERRKQAR